MKEASKRANLSNDLGILGPKVENLDIKEAKPITVDLRGGSQDMDKLDTTKANKSNR